MSYTPRSYEDIVRDMLTTLTGGTVRESLTVPTGDLPVIPAKLRNRPVRRISSLEGSTTVGVGAKAKEIPYRFTGADFELISSSGDTADLDSIRFRENGHRPVPGSALVVNYYPIQTDPVPLTDLNVGSVIRTVVETVARELAVEYQHLGEIYKSAFLATAENDSLDKVVELVGVSRLPSGHPVARLRFTRQSGATGNITVPEGTAVTDDKANRYLTLSEITMEPNESTREVLAGGETPGTAEVDEGALNRLEVMIAGISSVVNIQAARQLSAPETDADLRRRARGALHGVVRGTLDALRFGLLSIPGVKDVVIKEAPNGVAGEIAIQVAYTDQSTEPRQKVAAAIEELRPAGIRVIGGEAATLKVNVECDLTLTGSSLSGLELNSLTTALEDSLFAYLSKVPPGAPVRRAKLVQLAMSDDRVEDAKVLLTPQGQEPVEELTLDSGVALDVQRPFNFPPPAFAQTAAAAATTATVTATLPSIWRRKLH